MYTQYAIRHKGKAYLPEGITTEGKSDPLDCGHTRPEVTPEMFTAPWGYVTTEDGVKEYCRDCCNAIELEAVKTLSIYQGYFDLKAYKITTWKGFPLMRIVYYKEYQHNFWHNTGPAIISGYHGDADDLEALIMPTYNPELQDR